MQNFLAKRRVGEAQNDLLGVKAGRRMIAARSGRERHPAAPEPDWDSLGLPGDSPVLLEAKRRIKLIADTNRDVLILGESDVVRELAAQAIHELGARNKEPLVSISCPAELAPGFRSWSFGHCRVVSHGATEDSRDFLEQARGATVFIPEIGDLPLNLQTSLLCAFNERSRARAGESTARSADFRLVSATGRDLPAMVAHKSFLEGLYWYVAHCVLHMPSLDLCPYVKLLQARYLLALHAKAFHKRGLTFTQGAQDKLLRIRLSGGMRQLDGIMATAALFARSSLVRPEDIRDDFADKVMGLAAAVPDSGRSGQPNTDPTSPYEHDVMEKDNITKAILTAKGNVSEAARLTHVSRGTVYRKLSRYNVQRPRRSA
jgi:DNA-binding NtrC family response regulator